MIKGVIAGAFDVMHPDRATLIRHEMKTTVEKPGVLQEHYAQECCIK